VESKSESRPEFKPDSHTILFKERGCLHNGVEFVGYTDGELSICSHEGVDQTVIELSRTQVEQLLKFLDAWYWEVNEH